MRTIVLNQNNIVPGSNNNTLVYAFPNSVDLTGASIAVSNIQMYYSWDNINVLYTNNTFSYDWTNNLGVTNTFTVTIPNGLYEISDLNNFLQYTFIANGHYLVNASAQNVYYGEFLVNPTRYAVQINTYPVPTALPFGWSNPAALLFPPAQFNPRFTLPADFNEVLGFTAGFTTALNTGVGTTLSYLSSTAPQITSNSNLLVAISGIDNKYSNPSTIIYSLAPAVGIGELINEKPAQFNFNRLLAGTYNQIRIQLLGNDFRPITIRDPQMTIVLVIEDQDDHRMDMGANQNYGYGQQQQMLARSGMPMYSPPFYGGR